MLRTHPTAERWARLAAFALVAVGVLVRAWPLLHGHAWLNAPDLYDDGVYVGAAVKFVRGLWPYRDFVLVHPPGLTLLLSTVAWLPPSDAYVAARWLFVGVGAVNLVLCWWAAERWLGRWPAVVAVATYALFVDVVSYERGAYLEPLLNGLGLLLFALAAKDVSPRRALALGAVVGAMGCVKLVGVLWALPVLAWTWRAGPRTVLRAVVGALAVGLAVALPFWLRAPGFVDQLVGFHVWRPADGPTALWSRLTSTAERHWAPLSFLLLAFVAAALFARVRQSAAPARRFVIAWSLTSAGLAVFLLTSRTFWLEYVSVAAGPIALGMALAAASLGGALQPRPLALALVLALGVGAGFARIARVRQKATHVVREVAELGAFLAREVPNDACVLTLEPVWALAAGRVPHGEVDTYGALLLAAKQSAPGTPAPPLADAFATPGADTTFTRWLDGCDWVAWGRRGDLQAGPLTRAKLDAEFELVFPPSGSSGLPVYRRRLR